MIPINYVFAFFGLLIGSIFDIKTREIPDWLNFSLVGIGFGTAIIASIVMSNVQFLVSAVIGFIVAVVISMIFYKTGQWGGGDAKMLMGLGALIGIELNQGIPIFVVLLLNIFIIGAFYGTLWSVVLAIKHRRKFKKEFLKLVHSKKIMLYRKIVLMTVLFLFIVLFIVPWTIKPIVGLLTIFIFFAFYFYMYSKAVERSSMETYVAIEKLTEGDWVLETVKVNNKVFYKPSKEGIVQKDIDMLLKTMSKHKKSKIKIREGIPFLPSFFIAFVLTLLLGNWLLLIF